MKNTATQDLSIPLIDVLRKEYEHLYGFLPQPSGGELPDELNFKNSDEFLKRVLEAPVLTKNPDPQVKLYVINQESNRQKEASFLSDFEVLRFGVLKMWVMDFIEKERVTDTAKTQMSSDELITKDIIKTALKEKINDEYLVFNEEWMGDAPLRSFTRGLLDQFKGNFADKKKFVSKFGKAPESSDHEKSEAAVTVINRLVLEDVYRDFIEQVEDRELDILYKNMFQKNSNALCLSGGGIRSGTFALGILQGLANIRDGGEAVLKKFNYLSTVSGGGYIGGWLSSWIHQDGVDKVFKQLASNANYPQEAAPIRHLRQYSNYLTPTVGLFSADTWTLFAIYLRNLFLNWLIIIPFLSAVILLPWITVSLINIEVNYRWIVFWIIIASALMVYSDFFTKKNPPILQKDDSQKIAGLSRDNRDQPQFLAQCLLPGALAIMIWTMCWYWFWKGNYSAAPDLVSTFHDFFNIKKLNGRLYIPLFIVAGFTCTFVIVEWLFFLILEKMKVFPSRFQDGVTMGSRFKDFLYLVIAGTLSGMLLVAMAWILPEDGNVGKNAILYTCFAFPAFLMSIILIGFLYDGLKSSFAEDAEREWRARYSGWFLIVALCWLIMSALILYVAVLTQEYISYVASFSGVIGYLTAYLGQKSTSSADSQPAKSGKKAQSLTSYLTLPVIAFIAFIVLFVVLSHLDILLTGKIYSIFNQDLFQISATEVAKIPPLYPLLVLILMVALCSYFSFKINSNRFSLHAMYRSRLIRAYLGASRPEGVRRPDPFTGFDESDNIYMGNLAKNKSVGNTPETVINVKPFHIINITLNLVSGKNLAWQERKAASFTVSPLHAGSQNLGYRDTYREETQKVPVPVKNEKYYGGDHGITLGTAMTISGAAVNPNSGYSSSTLVSFFMTFFNLRLGWWLGNPGPAGGDSFHKSSPKFAFWPILSEMFGLTTDQGEYVNLSDGGHFENLGLYEMVMRRNRFIILSDASCDEKCELEDLGNAIRKIRIDFGINIDFPLGFKIATRSNEVNNTGQYWALGRIRYPEKGNLANIGKEEDKTFLPTDGILLYIKPAIYGSEPKDIFNYASVNSSFPHESTADQFFSESQFESYRALGVYAMENINKGLGGLGVSLVDLLGTGNWKANVIDKLNSKI